MTRPHWGGLSLLLLVAIALQLPGSAQGVLRDGTDARAESIRQIVAIPQIVAARTVKKQRELPAAAALAAAQARAKSAAQPSTVEAQRALVRPLLAMITDLPPPLA
ncbi:MAG: hypothetical protein JSR77_01245 [Planctomycetes bacterium]|nr:hypothetical protein [Planctomycetota bacterium]